MRLECEFGRKPNLPIVRAQNMLDNLAVLQSMPYVGAVEVIT